MSNTSYDVLDGFPVFLHFLVMTSALAWVSSDDHVGHHLVYSSVFLELVVFEKLLEETEEDSVLESLLLIPMTFTLILGKLSVGSLNDFEW